jgi:hypothetical protein
VRWQRWGGETTGRQTGEWPMVGRRGEGRGRVRRRREVEGAAMDVEAGWVRRSGVGGVV